MTKKKEEKLWNIFDGKSSEKETGDFLYGIIRLTKPLLVIETGSYLGETTLKMAQALRENGFGKIISCDICSKSVESANKLLLENGVSDIAEVIKCTGLELIKKYGNEIDFAYIDSCSDNVGALQSRGEEISELLKNIKDGKLIALHDTAEQNTLIKEIEKTTDIPRIYFDSLRGLTLFMKSYGSPNI